MRLKLLYAVIAAASLAAVAVAWDWYDVVPTGAVSSAQFVGRSTCAECHQPQHALWLGSDHDRAMELATDESVLADFNNTSFTEHGVTTRFFRDGAKFMVNTEGPDGQQHDYQIKYTFGVRPLQQYMVEFPDGRVQVLRVSWDTRNKKWFVVTPPDVTDERILPGDPLHWTGIAQNWNTTCADCHSTNVHKNYDPAKNTYHTTYNEIDVSCEECHGPGSVHVDLARKWSPLWDRNVGFGLVSLKNKAVDTQLETCAKCHARRYQVHEDFRPGAQFLDHYEPSLLTATLYHADGQIQDEVYEYGSFLQSKMYANRVQCTDCHDPHSLKTKFAGNALCTQCHLPAKYDVPAHHHHQPVAGLSEAGSQGKTGLPGSQTPATGDGTQCVDCHMPTRLYMVIDARRDHSFRVPRPDLSVELGTPNACNDCHTRADETFEWAADAVRKWYGDQRTAGPHWAAAFAAGRASKPGGDSLLVELLHNKQTPEIVRATALDLLANYPSPASGQVRRAALDDLDPLMRLTGMRTIAGDAGPALIQQLATKASDPVAAVRVAAASRLAYLPRQTLSDAQNNAFEQALIEFRNTQRLALDHAGGHLTLGALDRYHGRLADAIGHLQTAISLEPYLSGPRAALASLLEDQHGPQADIRQLRRDEAALLERDAKLAPNNGEIQYQLGLLRYLLGDLDAAQTALESACKLSPQNFDFLIVYALLIEHRYGQSGEQAYFDATVRALKSLHELSPADPRPGQIAKRLAETRAAKQRGTSNPNQTNDTDNR